MKESKLIVNHGCYKYHRKNQRMSSTQRHHVNHRVRFSVGLVCRKIKVMEERGRESWGSWPNCKKCDAQQQPTSEDERRGGLHEQKGQNVYGMAKFLRG